MTEVETRTCKVCLIDKPIESFALDGGRRRRQCRPCVYQRKLAKVKDWRKAHPDRVRELGRRSRREREAVWRPAAIAKLGGHCVRCGIGDVRVLELDHINGGGHSERLYTDRVSFYAAVARGDRTDIQLLCANCHRIKTYFPDPEDMMSS